MKTGPHMLYTEVLVAAFVIAKKWKKIQVSVIDKWITRIGYVHAVDHCSAIKWDVRSHREAS